MTTPLWVPLVVAALGFVSTVVGIVVTQIMANRRERASWQRDTDREQQRWQREDQARTFEHRHTAYVEFYEALRAMMLRVYDHGMGLSDEGNELPEGWQNDAAEAVRRLEVYAAPDVSTRAIAAYDATWRWGQATRHGQDDQAFYDNQAVADATQIQLLEEASPLTAERCGLVRRLCCGQAVEMAATVTVNDVLDGHVALDMECLDRIYLNGYVPNLQVGGQVVSFLTAHLGYPIPSPAILEKIGTAFRRAVASFAEDNHIPVVRFGKNDRKIDRDAAVSGPAGGDRPGGGGRDRGGAGVRAGVHRHQEAAGQRRCGSPSRCPSGG